MSEKVSMVSHFDYFILCLVQDFVHVLCCIQYWYFLVKYINVVMFCLTLKRVKYIKIARIWRYFMVSLSHK